jgi:hypothetical protein
MDFEGLVVGVGRNENSLMLTIEVPLPRVFVTPRKDDVGDAAHEEDKKRQAQMEVARILTQRLHVGPVLISQAITDEEMGLVREEEAK